jgi:hypothetical protein
MKAISSALGGLVSVRSEATLRFQASSTLTPG